MNKAFYRFVTAVLAAALTVAASAQNQSVKVNGTVTDANNEPLIGVGVMLENSTTGVVTGIDGDFSIEVPANSTLVFSSIGYLTKKVVVEQSGTITVTLEEDNQLLEESVVIGYGTTTRKNFTGSVSSVKMEDSPIINTTVNNAFSLLDGVVTGVNFRKSGEASSSPSMLVRGQKSIASSSSNPLIVLDGVIYTGSMNDIDPSTIESLSVLKDATSLAAYGSQAANGVIMITTKKGVRGKPVISFNTSLALVTPNFRPDMRDGSEYIELMNTRRRTSDPSDWMSSLQMERYKANDPVDWYKFITRKGFNQNYSLSFSGATDVVDYYVSASYLNNRNFIKGDEYDRLTTTARVNVKINQYISAGANFNQSYNRNDGIRPDYSAAVTLSPWNEPYLSDGRLRKYVDGVEITSTNPMWNPLNGQERENRRKSSVSGGNIEIKFPWVKGLSYKITGSYTENTSTVRSFTHETNFVNISLGEAGYTTAEQDKYLTDATGSISESKTRSWVIDNILTYNREIGDHYINATLVYTRDSQEVDAYTTSGSDFSAVGNTNLGFHGLNLAAVQKYNSMSYSLHNDIGYLARAIYAYRNTYHINLSVRRDGSSVFGAKHKWGIFPAVGFAWTLSNEPFFKVEAINNLKFKASWGLNGNQSLSPYGTLSTMNVGKSGGISSFFDESVAWGQSVAALGNADLGWESTASFNYGVEADFLKDRLHIEINGYKSKTTDQIFSRNIPVMGSGITSQRATMGRVDNWGIEADLRSININSRNFTWTTNMTFSMNRNKLVDLYGNGEDDIANSLFLGKSLGAIYGYKWIGIVQETDTDYMAANGAKPGDVKYGNIDGSEDGKITESDRTILGYNKDNFRLSMQNTFRYKSLQLYFLLNGTFGGHGYGLAQNNMAYQTYEGYANRNTLDHPFWTAEKPSNKYPSYAFSDNTRFTALQSYGFVRLQEANLSYSFNKDLVSKIGLSAMRVFVSGSNLFFIAPHWVGSDPEVRSYSSAQLPRTVTVGASITF
ncbi:MAG: TonB-dependent receptor [Bacteroidales bacterium]|nr:TonB-dependent receptor [Bacteroidales bacterium]